MSLPDLDPHARRGRAEAGTGVAERRLDPVLAPWRGTDEPGLDEVGQVGTDLHDPHAQVELHGDGERVEPRAKVADRARDAISWPTRPAAAFMTTLRLARGPPVLRPGQSRPLR